MREPVFARWFRIWGACSLPGTWFLALRLLWEATVLTAQRGPQMVGFSLAHSPAIIPLGLSVLLAAAWLLAGLVWLSVCAWRRRAPSSADLIQVLATAVPLAVLSFIPANT
jgi:hypothetical protein